MNGLEVSADPPFPSDAVEVGRIAGAWGVKGWIKVQAFSSDPQALFSSKRWFLKAPAALGAGVRPGSAWPALLRVVQAREQGDSVVAQIHDLSDRAAAEVLRGAVICVSRASFPTADAGAFYWVDLIGLSVSNREGQSLGVVTGLLETGAHCVLQILGDGDPAEAGKPVERLIPFVDAYIDHVDLEARRIVADWGLDY